MGKKRVRVEFDDGGGGRYVVSLDGNVSRDKILKLMDLVELMGGGQDAREVPNEDSQFGKVYSLIEGKFPIGAFTSSDLLEAYEDQYNQPMKLSTASTYLSRLTERRILARQKLGSTWAYKRIRLKPVES